MWLSMWKSLTPSLSLISGIHVVGELTGVGCLFASTWVPGHICLSSYTQINKYNFKFFKKIVIRGLSTKEQFLLYLKILISTNLFKKKTNVRKSRLEARDQDKRLGNNLRIVTGTWPTEFDSSDWILYTLKIKCKIFL